MEDNSFLVGDRVVCESIVGWIGEIMRIEENADSDIFLGANGETLYNIMYDEDIAGMIRHWSTGGRMVISEHIDLV